MDPDRFRTRTGIPLQIRPIQPTDRDALHSAFLKLSPRSRRLRFLGQVDDLDSAWLTKLTEVDHRDHEALVALDEGGELVGVARYVRLPDQPESAEVAVTIADDWQGQGIGTELLLRLERSALAAGVSCFTATCLLDNSQMLEVFRNLPGVTCTVGGPVAGVVEVRLEIDRPRDRTQVARSLRVGARAFSGARLPDPG